jgi:hypothetical protein
MPGFGGIGELAIGQSPSTAVALDWFQPLSIPVRQKPGLLPSEMQFAATPSFPPIVPFGWFAPLSEPVRTKPGLRPGQQQFTSFNPQPFVPFSWFEPLSEPVRFLPGLAASRQQFEARPPQLRPTPTTFGTLSATETKDIFLAGVASWQRVTSGEAGIVQNAFSGGEIGVGVAPITKASVAITIIK